MADRTDTSATPAVRPDPAEAATLPDVLPLLPLSDLVVFPHLVVPLLVTSGSSTRLIDDVVAGPRLVAVTLQKNPSDENPTFDHLHHQGCAARVMRMLKFPDESVRVLIQGLKRVELLGAETDTPYLKARVRPVEDVTDAEIETSALARNAAKQFQEIISLSPALPDELKVAIVNIDEPGKLADVIAANLNLSLTERQALLGIPLVRERLDVLTLFLNRELEVLHLGSEIQSKVSSALSKTQREYFLREQLKAIQKELGESGEQSPETKELRDQIEQARLPAEAKKTALKELDRLATIPAAAAEYTVARTYLDWLVGLPWSKSTEDHLSIPRARRVLN
ncbi:LON peptidase substrate-binding domain-containing protein, partial [bacterium]|nr:LON peptidase substrate-binding domain-containing protein [bacterium]